LLSTRVAREAYQKAYFMDSAEYDDFLKNVYKLLNKVIFFYFERKIYSFTTYDGFLFINLYTLNQKHLKKSSRFSSEKKDSKLVDKFRKALIYINIMRELGHYTLRVSSSNKDYYIDNWTSLSKL